MTRPRVTLVALAVLAALLAAGCSTPVQPPERPGPSPSAGSGTTTPAGPTDPPVVGRRPNVLVIETDDMRADELRWMPRTRALIAERGLTFANSFAPDPLCCPSRASFLTGQYSHNHHVLSHEEPYGFGAFDDADTLATRLTASGYRTALVGKYLNGYGVQPTFATGADSETYVPPGWTQWWAGNDRVRPVGDPLHGGTYSYFSLTSNVNGTLRSWPGRYSTDVTAEQTRALLERFGSASRERPWFVWWNPIAPHHGAPFEPDDPGTTRRSDGVPVSWDTPARPDWVKGTLDDRIDHGGGTRSAGSAEADRTDKPRYLRNLPELTAAERRALLTVTRQRAETLVVLDGQVARTLEALAASGQADDTIVVFTSDNGYYLGEHLKRQGKINLHEPSVRVPLLISGPGVPRGTRYDPVTTLDLARTIATWAGAELAAPDGQDLGALIREGDTGWEHPVVLEGLMPEAAYAAAIGRPGWTSDLDTVGVRTGRWKLVRYSTGETELYDLLADPLELDSIALAQAPDGVGDRLLEVWREYAGCAGAACLEPLPDDLRLSPAENQQLTDAQRAAEAAYYG